jgi:hypothetical protein
MQSPTHHDLDEKSIFLGRIQKSCNQEFFELGMVIVSTLASVSKSHAAQTRAAHVLFHEFYRVEILPMSDVHSRENRAHGAKEVPLADHSKIQRSPSK